MPARPLTRKDGPAPSGIVPSTGTHVVAIVNGHGEALGYVRHLGDARDRVGAEQSEARRPKGLRYEARPYEDLFGGEA